MPKLSEESLNKLTKPELIAFSVKKLQEQLALSKNISEMLSDQLVNMERQCWANAQYSRRECVGVAGIPQSVSASD